MMKNSRKFNDLNDRKSGQAIIFLMVVLIIGLFAVLWNFDLHMMVSSKIRIENAADAGALEAARWQGITLNMIGELNLIQAAILCENTNNYEAVSELSELKDRLALNGPLLSLYAAQPLAGLNLKTSDIDNINELLGIRASLERKADALIESGGYYRGVDEPYSGAWNEYGSLLKMLSQSDFVLQEEAGSSEFIGKYLGDHILFHEAIYSAIFDEDWCWFELTDNTDLLSEDGGYASFAPLPPRDLTPTINAEYFSSRIRRIETHLSLELNRTYKAYTNEYGDIVDGGWGSYRSQFPLHLQEDEVFANYVDSIDMVVNWPGVMENDYDWHLYQNEEWMYSWPTAEDGFPYRNGYEVKPEYNYGGADSVVEVRLPLTHDPIVGVAGSGKGSGNLEIEIYAAAKAFGYLESQGLGEKKPPHFFGLVLPAFHSVRLIPRGVSSGGGPPSNDNNYVSEEHMFDHLPLYLTSGVGSIEAYVDSCSYCRALILYEEDVYRTAGASWLESNSESCYPSNPPLLPQPGSRTPRPGNGGGGGADTSGSGGSRYRR